jgi:hypothetical protein
MQTTFIKIVILTTILHAAKVFGQHDRQKLDEKIFKKSVEQNAWSCDDTSKVKKGEIFLIHFPDNTINITYLNFAEGFYSATAKYTSIFENNFFELIPKKWKNKDKSNKKIEPLYIYGYLKNKYHLFITFKDAKTDMTNQLLNEKDWFDMTLYKK